MEDILEIDDVNVPSTEDSWCVTPTHPLHTPPQPPRLYTSPRKATREQAAVTPADWLQSEHGMVELDRLKMRLQTAYPEVCLGPCAVLCIDV